jgi:hypothetical protein
MNASTKVSPITRFSAKISYCITKTRIEQIIERSATRLVFEAGERGLRFASPSFWPHRNMGSALA